MNIDNTEVKPLAPNSPHIIKPNRMQPGMDVLLVAESEETTVAYRGLVTVVNYRKSIYPGAVQLRFGTNGDAMDVRFSLPTVDEFDSGQQAVTVENPRNEAANDYFTNQNNETVLYIASTAILNKSQDEEAGVDPPASLLEQLRRRISGIFNK